MADAAFTSRFVPSQDGLRLHYRDYGAASAGSTVVCLPGLARTAADFGPVASVLAAGGRRVLALDYRGRGLSDRDPDPTHYDLKVETGDVAAVLMAAGVKDAVFIGTSRGGLITMVLAGVLPHLIRGAVLNDIGPVIEAKGLERIRGYVGKLPKPHSWDDAVATLKRVAGSQFTRMTEADWLAYADSTFEVNDGVFTTRYDPALMHNLGAMDLSDIPSLWPQFDALADVPVLVIRGENSDLLSIATVEQMMERHPDCALVEVPGQGHAPFLNDADTLSAIDGFVSRCEGRARAG